MFGSSANQHERDDSAVEREREPTTEGTDESEDRSTEVDQQYFQVRPTESAFDPSSASAQFRRVHGLERPDDGGLLRSLLDRLRSSRDPPTLEVLLVAPGDGSLRYYVGIDSPEESLASTLGNVLRGLFPREYEVERVDVGRDPLEDLGVDGVASASSTDTGDRRVDATGVEYLGRATRRNDWQLPLGSVADLAAGEEGQPPLSAVADAMADRDRPAVYQALVRPMTDWTSTMNERIHSLRWVRDTMMSGLTDSIFVDPESDLEVPPENEARLDALDDRDASCSFAVTARAAILEDDGDTHLAAGHDPTARSLASAFGAVGREFHEVKSRVQTGGDGRAVLADVRDRQFQEPAYERLWTRLPVTGNRSRGIVADLTEVGNFCLLGGQSLTAPADRGVNPTRSERTRTGRPSPETLTTYDCDGLPLGYPKRADGTTSETPVTLHPDQQRLHTAIYGATGSGKTTTLANAILANQAATDGADVVLSPIGDGLATDYLQAHYARYGDLDDVLYFDCGQCLPAFSFFDVRDELAAGVPRTTAVENRVDHYVEVLEAVMGEERFQRAVRSPKVIRYLAKAQFDAATGSDAFAHADLLDAARTMAAQGSPPSVGDDRLQRLLDGVAANGGRSFGEVMAGAQNRMEALATDRRLAALFDHVPTGDDPQFDLGDHLDDDTVILIDTSGLRPEAQRVLSLVVLSNLWTALRRRNREQTVDSSPLVNLYVEEAASLAVSDLLGEVLAKGRGLDCAVTLAMQFPGQVRHDAPDVHEELLNNVGTVMTGPVPHDRRLAERLATADDAADDVAARLRALERGEWLLRPAAPYGEAPPAPFTVESLPEPPTPEPGGYTDHDETLEAGFEQARADLEARTKSAAAIEVPEAAEETAAAGDLDPFDARLDSALPHTNRLPKPVRYDEERHALRCAHCEGRHGSDLEAMRRAIECCSSMEQVDRESVPLCDVDLNLSPGEVADAEQSPRQLLFLQAVYDAQRLRTDSLAYDLLRDSMTVLRAYVGIDAEAVQELVDDGLLRHDTDYPHRLYSVTTDGRDVLCERYREGLDFGDGLGDMHESTEHRMAVELARRYLVAAYEDDGDSAVTEVRTYHDVEDRERLDVAGLDDDGEVVVALEAERMNGRQAQAVPDDYDTLAAHDPEEAIWLAMDEDGAHKLLDALNDPSDGVPRVEKSYSRSTRSQKFSIDTPGLTEVFIVDHLLEELGIE